MRCPQNTFSYTLKKGDTIKNIADRFSVTVYDILKYNTELKPNRLILGTQICVPNTMQKAGEKPPTTHTFTCESGKEYEIKKGDTLYAIAKENGLFVEQILQANPDLDPSHYEIGEKICIPTRQCLSGSNTYTVGPGENIYDILNKYDISYLAVSLYNSDVDLENLKGGQQLCLPQVFGPGKTCPIDTFSYITQTGDTLISISEKFMVQTKDIIKTNTLDLTKNIQSGTKICLPLKNVDDTETI